MAKGLLTIKVPFVRPTDVGKTSVDPTDARCRPMALKSMDLFVANGNPSAQRSAETDSGQARLAAGKRISPPGGQSVGHAGKITTSVGAHHVTTGREVRRSCHRQS